MGRAEVTSVDSCTSWGKRCHASGAQKTWLPPQRGGVNCSASALPSFSFKNQNQENCLHCSVTLKESPRPRTAGGNCPACLFFFFFFGGGGKNADYFLKCRCGTRMKPYCQQLTLISLKAKIHSTVVISPGISSNSKSTLN